MSSMVELPLWLLIIIIAFAFIMVLDRILLPSVRWFFRRKVNKIIGEVNDKLSIQIRSFQLTRKQTLVDRLVFDEQVFAAIRQYAKDNDMPMEVAQEKAYEYAREIVPKFNAYMYFKFGHWLSKTISRLIYRMKVGFYDDGELQKIDPKSSVVFVMNHRSNMDYVVVSFLVMNRTALSYAVGEWARVWPLATLIRSMGAFFVRRNSNNPLYRKVLERYVHYSTRAGVSQAVYPEGGLSKDGLLKSPKLGFIDYLLRDFNPETDRDIVFIPVGLNYDRVIEDRSLERSRHKDLPKQSKWFVFKTTAKFALKTLFMKRKERWKRFGYAGVNFAKPVSAKDYFKSLKAPLNTLDKEERIAQVKSFTEDLMTDIAQVVPVLPVALVSSVIKDYQFKSHSREELLDACCAKIEKLRALGAPVKIKEQAFDGILTKTLDLLVGRELLLEKNGLFCVTDNSQPIISYYANSLAQWDNIGH
ncbi:MAG: 1-acyl-sn-glycerol-3-phosphate acyltransferase [Gammaproteobacteria bacterium]|nr:1-acyl-sn-glycerol-3-phosphate acyltransferase [Gammaproteobacteria bacterium]